MSNSERAKKRRAQRGKPPKHPKRSHTPKTRNIPLSPQETKQLDSILQLGDIWASRTPVKRIPAEE